MGTVNASLAHPREIFQPAINNSAASIILVHNHPSDNAEASHDDIKITQRIKKASQLLGITLTDHIIISQQAFYSLKNNKLL